MKNYVSGAAQRDLSLNKNKGLDIADVLLPVLNEYSKGRVLVLGEPCSGKSTLLQHIPKGIDMDIVFDDMPLDFRKYVLHHDRPYVQKVGDIETIKYTERVWNNTAEDIAYLKMTTDALTKYVNENIQIVPGNPLFSTTIVDSDVIIYLDLLDEILRSRIESRNRTHRPVQSERIFAIRNLIRESLEEIEQSSSNVIVKKLKIIR